MNGFSTLLLAVSIALAYSCDAPGNGNGRVSKKVLMLGNSYTKGNKDPKDANNKELADQIVEFAKANGWDLDITVDASNNRHLSELVDSLQKDDFKATISQKYDIITVQDESTNPAKSTKFIQENAFPTSATIVKALREHNPDARILFYETWGRHNGKRTVDGEVTYESLCKEFNTLCSYDGMQNRLRDTYHTLAYLNAPAEVIPVGETIQLLKNYFDHKFYNTEYYTDDFSHPTKLGNHLVASVISQSITGLDNTRTTYKGNDLKLKDGTTPVSDDQLKKLMYVAKIAYENGKYKYEKNCSGCSAPVKYILDGFDAKAAGK